MVWWHCNNCGRTRRGIDDFLETDGLCALCRVHRRREKERRQQREKDAEQKQGK